MMTVGTCRPHWALQDLGKPWIPPDACVLGRLIAVVGAIGLCPYYLGKIGSHRTAWAR